ncbi:hypothetical protein E2C01_070680 [Portunus trituberculatus]|uniref:Uncharacterized protein n=1 Tax=Portunus trituberculatus TaxID=210409 RepID=A0A5B7HXY4_PORTR|nr:hypothetical protein [Portunus trituberculatus]
MAEEEQRKVEKEEEEEEEEMEGCGSEGNVRIRRFPRLAGCLSRGDRGDWKVMEKGEKRRGKSVLR